MLTGNHYVIGGLSRLTVRVANALRERNADVIVIGDTTRGVDVIEVANLLGDDIKIIDPGTDRDRALEDAGIGTAAGFLALDELDLENLRFVADAHELAPGVPNVLRTFQPELADAVARDLNIRRAFSVEALAAPAIVAAAVGEQVVETMRAGEEDVPMCVLAVHARSPLEGSTPDDIKAGTNCAVIAVQRVGGKWDAAPSGSTELHEGDRAFVGGRLHDVLDVAVQNERGAASTHRRRRRSNVPKRARRPILHASLLRVTVLVFLVLFTLTALINVLVLSKDVNDAMTSALGAALGNTLDSGGFEWVQWFNLATTVAGVVLLWVLLSHITAIVLAERLEVRMSKRARRLRNHVVVVGLGKVGYRVVQLLAELKVPAVAIEQAPDSSFLEAVAVHTPVLTGDGALAENLARTGIGRARCVIACTDNDLANLAACVEARRANPAIRTVTRAFDETVSKRLSRAFKADVVLSSTAIAASAFVRAAVDVLAMRSISLDGLELLAFRFSPATRIDAGAMAGWRARGLRVLALVRDGKVEPPTVAVTHAIETSDEAVVVGPDAVVREFTAAHA